MLNGKEGVYERLIKSVKLSLHKSLGKTIPSHDELLTVLAEIENLLNTRSLLYMESDSPSEKILRPIDFLRNEFEVLYPLDRLNDEQEYPSFLPPEERSALRTKMEVVQALQSSCRLTERFWRNWQTVYLSSLREKHQLEIAKQRGSSSSPKKDTIVLIQDPTQSRHC